MAVTVRVSWDTVTVKVTYGTGIISAANNLATSTVTGVSRRPPSLRTRKSRRRGGELWLAGHGPSLGPTLQEARRRSVSLGAQPESPAGRARCSVRHKSDSEQRCEPARTSVSVPADRRSETNSIRVIEARLRLVS